MLSYERLFHILSEKDIPKYRLVKEHVIGGATLDKLMGKVPGHIDGRSINNLCRYLNCQPGDIMEYIPDKD